MILFPGIQASARRAAITFSVDSLLEFFKALKGNRLMKFEGIPDDAKVVGCYVQDNYITILLESKEFGLHSVESLPYNINVKTSSWDLDLSWKDE